MIRVLIDMNLAPRWASALGGHGIEAIHWSSVGAPNAPDKALFSWAASSSSVILTSDLDFTHMLALSGAKGPSVVLLRARDTTPQKLSSRVAGVLRDHEVVLACGALVVIDEAKSRVKVLPLRA